MIIAGRAQILKMILSHAGFMMPENPMIPITEEIISSNIVFATQLFFIIVSPLLFKSLILYEKSICSGAEFFMYSKVL